MLLRGSTSGAGSSSAAASSHQQQGSCLYRHLPSHVRQQAGARSSSRKRLRAALEPCAGAMQPKQCPIQRSAGASTSAPGSSVRWRLAVASREDLSLEQSHNAADLFAFRQRLTTRFVDMQTLDADLQSFAQGAKRGAGAALAERAHGLCSVRFLNGAALNLPLAPRCSEQGAGSGESAPIARLAALAAPPAEGAAVGGRPERS
jgi:hypothetical protein